MGRDCQGLTNWVDGQYFQGHEGDWLIVDFGEMGKSDPYLELELADKNITTIVLQAQSKKGWEDIALLHPRENWSTQLIELSSTMAPVSEGLKLRLYWKADHKLDYVGLAQPYPSDLTVQECPLKSAVHSQIGPAAKYLLSVDREYVELFPDEQIDLAFSSLEPPPKGYERDFILVSTGYYTTDKTYANVPKVIGDYQIPISFSLSQNYPNPFNLQTEIEYALPKDSHVTLQIYNVQGQLVRTLVDEDQGPGYHKILWDGRDSVVEEVASGIYFYQIKAREFVQSKRMVLLK